MELSVLTEALSQHPLLRGRIEAIVRAARWDDEDADLEAPIPLDAIAWAVAVRLCPEPQDTAEDGTVTGHSVEDAVEAITDAKLRPFVIDQALPRLTAAAEADRAELARQAQEAAAVPPDDPAVAAADDGDSAT